MKTIYLQKIIETKITKNTTDSQLKEIKESLKNEGIDFKLLQKYHTFSIPEVSLIILSMVMFL